MIYWLSNITNGLIIHNWRENGMCDFGLPPRNRWELHHSGLLRSELWWFLADASDAPKRRQEITTTRCAVTQNSTALKKTNFFSVVGKFRFLQVFQVWIIGTKIFPLKKKKEVSVLSRLRLKQVALHIFATLSNICKQHDYWHLILLEIRNIYFKNKNRVQKAMN